MAPCEAPALSDHLACRSTVGALTIGPILATTVALALASQPILDVTGKP